MKSFLISLLFGLGVSSLPAFAGDRVIYNPDNNGNVVIRVNSGGTVKDVMSISGASGVVSLTEPLPASSGGVPPGALMPFAGSSAPTGWLLADGTAVSRTTYAALFAAIGTSYGAGNGTTTFNIPDMRGRAAFGKDNMGGVAANRLTSGGSGVDGVTLGASGGSQSSSLATANLPSHNHTNDHNHAAQNSSSESGHNHSISHDHGAFSSANDGPHAHIITTSRSTGGSQSLIRGVTGVGADSTEQTEADGSHSHSIDPPNFSGTSGPGSSHLHSVDLPNYTGVTGTTGSGTAFSNVGPAVVVNYIVKY